MHMPAHTHTCTHTAELMMHHLNKRHCILFLQKYIFHNRNIMHIDARRAPSSGILERPPVSGIFLRDPQYQAFICSVTQHWWPSLWSTPKSGMQRSLLNGKATYGSLYLVVWVIFHYFYRTEGLPFMYKSPSVCDTCGWIVKTTTGSSNSLSILPSQWSTLRRHLKTRKDPGEQHRAFLCLSPRELPNMTLHR